jgi:hypothetical protein
MSMKQIGYLALSKGTIDCACKGENIIVMNNPVKMKSFVKRNFKLKQIELQKVFSEEVIKGLKQGGHYLFSEKSYKDFMSECIDDYPQLFPPHRLVVMEPVSTTVFYQVSWNSTSYNTPK